MMRRLKLINLFLFCAIFSSILDHTVVILMRATLPFIFSWTLAPAFDEMLETPEKTA